MKKALVTGITGQDGSYLAELLLKKGYEVHGILRRSSSSNTSRIEHFFDHIHRHYGDLCDGLNIYHAIDKIQPDEIYHLGAQSHVRVSFDTPVYTADVTGVGTIRILEAIKEINPKIKFYNAASSEMFGKVQEIPQKETTPFHPRSPYGCSKVFSYWVTVNYREAYGLYACSGILFNHESPRRGRTFVTKKIIDYVRSGPSLKQKLQLGNLEAKRDWGYAGDYVEMVWLMLQQEKPDDFVIATGETHTVKEFCQEAFKQVGIENFMDFIEVNPIYYRPAEVDLLVGDPSKAKKKLGWEPKIKFKELIALMLRGE